MIDTHAHLLMIDDVEQKINTMKNKNFLLNFMRRKATAAIKMSNAVEKWWIFNIY